MNIEIFLLMSSVYVELSHRYNKLNKIVLLNRII